MDSDVPMFRGNPAHTGQMPGVGPQGDPVLLWKFATHGGGDVCSVAVLDGMVFVGSSVGIYAIDAISGQQRWHSVGGFAVSSTPTVVDGTVYAGSFNGNLYALDAATGQQHWFFAIGGWVHSSPAVDGLVYASSDDILYALDAATGQQRWSFATGGWVASPAVVDGTVYAGS